MSEPKGRVRSDPAGRGRRRTPTLEAIIALDLRPGEVREAEVPDPTRASVAAHYVFGRGNILTRRLGGNLVEFRRLR